MLPSHLYVLYVIILLIVMCILVFQYKLYLLLLFTVSDSTVGEVVLPWEKLFHRKQSAAKENIFFFTMLEMYIIKTP